MSKINLFVFGPLALLICALYSTCPPRPPEQCREFLQLSHQQRHAEFRAYPLDKQLDVYLCAMKTEPPNSSLANDIADQGEQAIPALVNKLKVTKSEVDQEDLIYVFELMSDRIGHGEFKPEPGASIIHKGATSSYKGIVNLKRISRILPLHVVDWPVASAANGVHFPRSSLKLTMPFLKNLIEVTRVPSEGALAQRLPPYEELCEHIMSASSGNPMHVIEQLKFLIDEVTASSS